METHFEGKHLDTFAKKADRGILYDMIKRNGYKWVSDMMLEIVFELGETKWRHENDS